MASQRTSSSIGSVTIVEVWTGTIARRSSGRLGV
jgi:hypothetical protein